MLIPCYHPRVYRRFCSSSFVDKGQDHAVPPLPPSTLTSLIATSLPSAPLTCPPMPASVGLAIGWFAFTVGAICLLGVGTGSGPLMRSICSGLGRRFSTGGRIGVPEMDRMCAWLVRAGEADLVGICEGGPSTWPCTGVRCLVGDNPDRGVVCGARDSGRGVAVG